jgi:hypothetical protein
MALARAEPQEFEIHRRRLIDEFLVKGNNIRRMRGLQIRLDMERTRARTPLNSCLRIYDLMLDSLLKLNHELTIATASNPSAASGKAKSNIISFPKTTAKLHVPMHSPSLSKDLSPCKQTDL